LTIFFSLTLIKKRRDIVTWQLMHQDTFKLTLNFNKK
jgi:hypothetical protein